MTWLRGIHPPRYVARVLAALLGYFYLPCPNCGKMFAGWETGHGMTITERWAQGFSARMWCWRCPDEKRVSPSVVDR